MFTTVFASAGLASNQWLSCSLQIFCTNDLTSVLPSLVLVWPSNCGSADLHRDDRGQTLADVVAGEVGVLLLEQLLVLGVLVDHRRQRAAEALFVRAALVGVDGVREGVHRLGVAGVPLHCDLDLVAGTLAVEVDDALLDRRLRAVDVLDVVDQTAGVVEGAVLDLVRALGLRLLLVGGLRRLGGVADDLVDDLVGGDALVDQVDGQALVEERHLLQPPRHGLEVVDGGLEDVRDPPRTGWWCRSSSTARPASSVPGTERS